MIFDILATSSKMICSFFTVLCVCIKIDESPFHCSNPDQSKHLETARMRLFDLWIDFVNLRSEDYCENSRIPTMVNDLHHS